jgi:hypothetical protein
LLPAEAPGVTGCANPTASAISWNFNRLLFLTLNLLDKITIVVSQVFPIALIIEPYNKDLNRHR